MRARTPFVQHLLRAVINVAYTRFKADKDIAPLLFSMFFAAVINVAYTIFKADKDTMDALIHLRKKRRRGGGREQQAGTQSWSDRFGACFTLAMPESYRNHPNT